MADVQISTIEKATKPKYDQSKVLLCMAMALSAWGDRMWNFAIGIYFISLNPASLLSVAINGIVLNLAVILFGSAVGNWIDRSPRLPAIRKTLYVQNLSVASMAGLVIVALLYKSSLATRWMLVIQGLLIMIGIISVLASVANKVAISKDWVVALYASDRESLTNTNAMLRRIDLLSGVLAPIVTGAIMAFISRWASAVLIAGWNIVSLCLELILYTKVYRLAEAKLASKKLPEKSSSEKRQKLFSKFGAFAEGFKTYHSLAVFLPGISLSLLYMTVLSFDSVTRAYVIEQGLSEVWLGILNGCGSILGIVGTLLYPLFVKHTGLVRTGVIGFWSEFSMLILCLSSLFVHGTLFEPLRYTSIYSCHINGSINANSTLSINSYPCSKSQLSVLLLVLGITLNRVGLWIADLTVSQLQQERVPENVRGRVGGTQEALNKFFDMLRYILIVILPRIPQFGYHICLSVLSVFSASLIYTFWSCSSAAHIHPTKIEKEMDETKFDLAAYYETHLGETLEYADDENKN